MRDRHLKFHEDRDNLQVKGRHVCNNRGDIRVVRSQVDDMASAKRSAPTVQFGAHQSPRLRAQTGQHDVDPSAASSYQ